ncbi:MAG: hypothetical protein RIS50_1054 [Bacteroidota bacterium]
MSQVQKIAAQLVKHRVKMAVLALFCLLLGSLQLGKIDVTGNLGGFDAPGVPVFEDAKQFDSLFGGVRTKVFVSVTPKKGADYSLWKECADIENGLRKLSAGIEIISPRRFVRGYYGLVDPQHEIPKDSMLRTLSTHPQLGKLISKDKSSFLLLLTFPNDSIPQKALQDWIEQPRSMIEQTRIFGLVQLESAIEETIIKDIALVSACIALFFACFIYCDLDDLLPLRLVRIPNQCYHHPRPAHHFGTVAERCHSPAIGILPRKRFAIAVGQVHGAIVV